MKHSTQKIRIPEPCSENWDLMLPEEKGRHCEKCAKTVVDFTGMSDTSVLNYLMHNKKACGRFNNHQLNRKLVINAPSSPLTRFGRRMAFAGLFAMQLWPRKGEAQAVQADTSGIGNTIEVQPVAPVFINYSSLRGKVVQPDSLPLRALKLQFRIDTFFIEVDVDSSGVFNFQYPAGMRRDSAEVKIMSSDSVFILKILNLHDNSNLGFNVFQQGGELMLVCDKTWTCYFTAPDFTFPQIPPITWGIPMIEFPRIEFPYLYEWKFKPVLLDTIQTFIATGGMVTLDSVGENDTPVKVLRKQKKTKRKDVGFISLHWIAGILSGLAALFFWFRKEKKVEQSQEQRTTEDEN